MKPGYGFGLQREAGSAGRPAQKNRTELMARQISALWLTDGLPAECFQGLVSTRFVI
jgi:hypothetical protein